MNKWKPIQKKERQLDWVSVEEKLPDVAIFGKFKVKTNQLREFPAFYCKDGMSWIAFYGHKSSAWSDCHSGELLHNVTHWKNLEEK